MLGVTIRIGAAYDEVRTADGTVIDRSKLTRPLRRKLTRMVRDIYEMHLNKETNGR